ncbi:MAG TPA: type III pantothenate kinase [Bacteroidia bacterium]|jgi:type III pantothenate kinase|nr:type III pantothenate kinase [Bacteroidia bacterium]
MNLVIDIGNSRVKTGIFAKGKLLKNNTYNSFNLTALKSIFLENHGIENSILCSVKKYPATFKRFLSQKTNFIELTYQTPIPIRNTYKTPQTLGMDRLAAVCGAYSLYREKNILVVNTGTCITYDFLDNKGQYRGGSISPGLDIRYKALHTFTGGLPLITPDTGFKKLTGTTTTEAIRSGVQVGIVKEVEGIIREYQSNWKDLTVILTGGSMQWMLKSLKIKIKGEPYLVLTGLNVILSPFEKQDTLA